MRKILAFFLVILTLFSFTAAVSATEKEIVLDQIFPDSSNVIMISGTNNSHSKVDLAMTLLHAETKTIIAADVLTAEAGKKFYFDGVRILSDGSMLSGEYEIRVSDKENSLQLFQTVYVATIDEIYSTLCRIADGSENITDILLSEDDGVSYCKCLGIDEVLLRKMKNRDFVDNALNNSRKDYKPMTKSEADVLTSSKLFKKDLNNYIAIQEYNNAANDAEIEEWINRFVVTDSSISGYDPRFDFDGEENPTDGSQQFILDMKQLHNLYAAFNDLKSLDKNGEKIIQNCVYSQMSAFGKIDVNCYTDWNKRDWEEDNLASACISKIRNNFQEAILLICVEKMPSAYSRSLIMDNDGLIRLDSKDYKDLNTTQKITAIENVMGKKYTNVSDLIQAINKSFAEVLSNTSGKVTGTGGNGNSGPSGKSNGFTTSIVEIMNNNNSDEVLYDNSKHFNDVINMKWASAAIDKLYEDGIFSGYSDGSFQPYSNITRAEFVKIIVAAFDFETNGMDCTFADVSKDAWYYRYISSAAALGIINGTDDNKFEPEQKITREDIAVILDRAIQLSGKTYHEGELKYSDTDNISEYAKISVSRLSNNNIINGMDDGSFYPKAPGTRAQVAKMIYGVLYNK